MDVDGFGRKVKSWEKFLKLPYAHGRLIAVEFTVAIVSYCCGGAG